MDDGTLRRRRDAGADTAGDAPTHKTAYAPFSAAWKVFLPERTEADFGASRRQRQWTVNKYALWDAG
jgi:hypothetical protein